MVCCTHLHFDHVGWNTRLESDRWVPTFPNARYLFCRQEYEAFTAEPSGYALNLDDTVQPVVAAGLADLVEPTHRLTGEVRLVPSPGHSPGHVCVLIESGGERALITGDATHHPVQWAEPDWGMSGDFDGAQGAETRRRLRAEHGGRGTLVIGTHYAAPSAGYVVEADGGWRFELWSPPSPTGDRSHRRPPGTATMGPRPGPPPRRPVRGGTDDPVREPARPGVLRRPLRRLPLAA